MPSECLGTCTASMMYTMRADPVGHLAREHCYGTHGVAPSPGADVAEVSAVPVQMWERWQCNRPLVTQTGRRGTEVTTVQAAQALLLVAVRVLDHF